MCDLIEKFECAGKFTLCGNHVNRKYWLIADRPNEAKKCGLFASSPDFMGAMPPPAPSSYTQGGTEHSFVCSGSCSPSEPAASKRLLEVSR